MKEMLQPKGLSDPRPRYTQAIMTKPGRLLFIAGQTASDTNGNVVGKGDIETQATQVMQNIKTVLNEVGGSLQDVVKTTTYITDIKYREGLHKARSRFFEKDPPTSTLIVVKGLAREEYLVEIEAIAVLE
jgi:enamine deaminase RidA (YjgF/YER057c/UK114 family)